MIKKFGKESNLKDQEYWRDNNKDINQSQLGMGGRVIKKKYRWEGNKKEISIRERWEGSPK
jgi:hypothetical protein